MQITKKDLKRAIKLMRSDFPTSTRIGAKIKELLELEKQGHFWHVVWLFFSRIFKKNLQNPKKLLSKILQENQEKLNALYASLVTSIELHDLVVATYLNPSQPQELIPHLKIAMQASTPEQEASFWRSCLPDSQQDSKKLDEILNLIFGVRSYVNTINFMRNKSYRGILDLCMRKTELIRLLSNALEEKSQLYGPVFELLKNMHSLSLDDLNSVLKSQNFLDVAENLYWRHFPHKREKLERNLSQLREALLADSFVDLPKLLQSSIKQYDSWDNYSFVGDGTYNHFFTLDHSTKQADPDKLIFFKEIFKCIYHPMPTPDSLDDKNLATKVLKTIVNLPSHTKIQRTLKDFQDLIDQLIQKYSHALDNDVLEFLLEQAWFLPTWRKVIPHLQDLTFRGSLHLFQKIPYAFWTEKNFYNFSRVYLREYLSILTFLIDYSPAHIGLNQDWLKSIDFEWVSFISSLALDIYENPSSREKPLRNQLTTDSGDLEPLLEKFLLHIISKIYFPAILPTTFKSEHVRQIAIIVNNVPTISRELLIEIISEITQNKQNHCHSRPYIELFKMVFGLKNAFIRLNRLVKYGAIDSIDHFEPSAHLEALKIIESRGTSPADSITAHNAKHITDLLIRIDSHSAITKPWAIFNHYMSFFSIVPDSVLPSLISVLSKSDPSKLYPALSIELFKMALNFKAPPEAFDKLIHLNIADLERLNEKLNGEIPCDEKGPKYDLREAPLCDPDFEKKFYFQLLNIRLVPDSLPLSVTVDNAKQIALIYFELITAIPNKMLAKAVETLSLCPFVLNNQKPTSVLAQEAITYLTSVNSNFSQSYCHDSNLQEPSACEP